MRALISVSDKTNIDILAKFLVDNGYEIISTGGTLKFLKDKGINCLDVSDITQFPEMLDGRVKTLHPFIHGGILHKRDDENHLATIKKHKIKPIDLVCVNLYPFKNTTKNTDDFDEIIENIDIGGPSLIRASAKNFKDCLILSDVSQYEPAMDAIKNSKDDFEFRRDLMIKAYENTASYDSFIATYMSERYADKFPENKSITATKVMDTRYGENPHQQGALYQFDDYFNDMKILKGELSFNNIADMDGAVKIISNFTNEKCVAIVKHGNACGFAVSNETTDAYDKSLICDTLSAYGGVIAVGDVIDKTLAEKLNKIFFEVIISYGMDDEALEVFASKKRVKIITISKGQAQNKVNFKSINGGFLLQNADDITDEEVYNAKQVSSKSANKSLMDDLNIANKISALTKSNCISCVKDGTLLAIGMGMTSRVDAMRFALDKAIKKKIDTKGSCISSEAFFPFKDSIELASKYNISAIIQPGGSIRDDEVIECANEKGIALYFSGKRHFLH